MPENRLLLYSTGATSTSQTEEKVFLAPKVSFTNHSLADVKKENKNIGY
ncbi:hypothetical protein KKF69_08555 [Patescibacteria group bacterium]|nr:hypothetical protein [Patescibacteria group bacterium]